MSYFAVHYTYVDDAAELSRHRPAHRDFLRGLLGAGLLAAGAYPEAATPAALLIVEAESEQAVAEMLDNDPFLLQGVIAERVILLWNPPIGVFA